MSSIARFVRVLTLGGALHLSLALVPGSATAQHGPASTSSNTDVRGRHDENSGTPSSRGAGSVRAQVGAVSGARHGYAIVVGSNEAGAGQGPLRYAESDATAMREVLVDLGGFDSGRVTLLRSPDVAGVERALTDVRERIAVHRRRGESVQLVFYYSGHARARGLHLGDEELQLARLRGLLADMGADFTLVLLDACQSGAYGRVRGVEPAADFSVSSLEQLRTTGLVVMASSSDDELSQESETLRGGFFTHHLVVGLRGAADVDGDGRVTLDEAYRYAYAHTLADTSRTAVGGQHVTLETDLTGHGQVALSYPAEAGSHLVLPSRLEGRVLTQHLRSGVVVAEVDKVRGSPVSLALPAGHYVVLVRQPRAVHECDVTLRRDEQVPVDLGRCEERDPSEDVRPRGDMKGPLRASWAIEASFGFMIQPPDDYVDRLGEFGYATEVSPQVSAQTGVALERRLPRRMSLLMRAQVLELRDFVRREGGVMVADDSDFFSFQTFGVGVAARVTELLRQGRVGFYGQLGGGFGFAHTRFAPSQEPATSEMYYGYYLEAGGGFRWMPTERFGLFMELGWVFAPVIENRIGDTHDAGGLSILVGMRGEVRE